MNKADVKNSFSLDKPGRTDEDWWTDSVGRKPLFELNYCRALCYMLALFTKNLSIISGILAVMREREIWINLKYCRVTVCSF